MNKTVRHVQGDLMDKIFPLLQFEILAQCPKSMARASNIHLSHQMVEAPVFMPVGTQGTMKGLTVQQLRNLRCQILLGNTYHLGLRPGEELLEKAGGLHRFMGWDGAMLTDSGGFQMVSLLKLARITEEGVLFTSPRDPTRETLLTPEKSMELQIHIGADIVMQLDDVVPSLTSGPRVTEAMERSVRWLDRCRAAHQPKNGLGQSLFPIIQGGMDYTLRTRCMEEMIQRDAPGYAIGGLSGGEDKDAFWRIVLHCTQRLPRDRPIYCMGVGYAEDLVVCVALGVDMFDCVYPTRTARFGTALTRYGNLPLRQARFRDDYTPIEPDCPCATCRNGQGVTRAYLHSVVARETVGCHLLTIHNLSFQLRLMRDARQSIIEGCFPSFLQTFFSQWYKTDCVDEYPQWVHNALHAVAISLTSQVKP